MSSPAKTDSSDQSSPQPVTLGYGREGRLSFQTNGTPGLCGLSFAFNEDEKVNGGSRIPGQNQSSILSELTVFVPMIAPHRQRMGLPDPDCTLTI